MNILQYIYKYAAMFSVRDAIDILIIAFLTYKLIKLISRSTAGRVVKGIILLLVATQVAQLFGLKTVNFLLGNTMQLGLLALVIVFQPELRKALEQVGKSRITQFVDRTAGIDYMDAAIVQTVEACQALSWSRDGALIVFERQILLNDIVKTGTVINGDPTSQLIKNVFYPKAPMHDGAVIMQRGRVSAAGCMLPLSSNTNLSKELGMRHRAGVGMSENSDAVVVIVSEETGSISVAMSGMLKRHLAPETLEKLLRNELMPKAEENKKTGLFGFLKVKKQ
ncbi:MAG: diadenylate cyclase CdaA [Clostridia bacterium]